MLSLLLAYSLHPSLSSESIHLQYISARPPHVSCWLWHISNGWITLLIIHSTLDSFPNMTTFLLMMRLRHRLVSNSEMGFQTCAITLSLLACDSLVSHRNRERGYKCTPMQVQYTFTRACTDTRGRHAHTSEHLLWWETVCWSHCVVMFVMVSVFSKNMECCVCLCYLFTPIDVTCLSVLSLFLP